MGDISNRTLSLFLVTAIILSLGFTIYGLDRLSPSTITGRATTPWGRLNLTVESQVSIVLTSSTVDFGSGIVNSTKCQTNATLNAGATYNDSENYDCWTAPAASSPLSLNVQNDGNRNVQLTVKGPDQRAFLNYSGAYPNNFTWRARNNESNSCRPGALTFQTAYTDFGGAPKTVCSNMTYQPNTNDEIAVDIQLVIPADISPGARTNSSIEFTAVATN